MITCPRCGRSLTDSASFCDGCGARLKIKFICSNCGGEVNENDSTCSHCNAIFEPEFVEEEPVMGDLEPEMVEEPMTAMNHQIEKAPVISVKPQMTDISGSGSMAKPSASDSTQTKGSNHIPVIIAAVAVAVVAIIVLVVVLANRGDSSGSSSSPSSSSSSSSPGRNRSESGETKDDKDKNEKNEDDKDKDNTDKDKDDTSKDDKGKDDVGKDDKDSDDKDQDKKDHDEKDIPIEGDEKEVKNHEDDFLWYIRNDGLFYSDLKGNEVEMSSSFSFDKLMGSFYVAKEGVLFYPESNDLKNGFTLCCKSVNDPEQEALRIDDNITDYYVNTINTLVTYLTVDKKLYRFDIGKKEKEVLARDVKKIYATNNGVEFLYFDEDGGLWYCSGENNEKEKIASEIENIVSCSDTLNEVLFTKKEEREEQQLYVAYYWKRGMEEARELVAGIDPYKISAFRNGTLYYLKDEIIEVKEEEWEKKYSNSYLERLETDGQVSYKVIDKKMFFFDGESHTEVCDNVAEDFYLLPKSQTILFKQIEGKNRIWFAAKGRGKIELPVSDIANYATNSEGNVIYFIGKDENGENDASSGANSFKLYRIDAGASELKTAEEFDNDVWYGELKVGSDADTVIYAKEYDDHNSVFDLYMNKKRVAAEIRSFKYDDGSGKLYFTTDYSQRDMSCTLFMYYNGEKKKISDDISMDYSLLSDGCVLYLKDYNQKKSCGDLYLYDNETKKISEEVSWVIPRSLD